LTLVTKSIDIKTPVDSVFTYFARPEHVSDQIKNDTVGMTVIPMDIKEGMGVGTTFRIIGDFSGKRLEWDCETTEFIRNEKITAKQIEGPFKSWQITNEFKALGNNLTRVTMSVDYARCHLVLWEQFWIEQNLQNLLKKEWILLTKMIEDY